MLMLYSSAWHLHLPWLLICFKDFILNHVCMQSQFHTGIIRYSWILCNCSLDLMSIPGANKKWCFTCEFESLILKSKDTNSPISPVGILSQLQNIGSQLGNGREEDAHEFLRCCLHHWISENFDNSCFIFHFNWMSRIHLTGLLLRQCNLFALWNLGITCQIHWKRKLI